MHKVLTFVPDSCTDKTVVSSGLVLLCKVDLRQKPNKYPHATAISLFNIISLLKRHPSALQTFFYASPASRL